MKKVVLFVLSALCVSSVVMAAEPVGNDAARKMHRMEMKKIKQSMHETAKTQPQTTPSQGKGFWEKEGERSGLGNSGSGVSNFISQLNPAPFFRDQNAKYKARKGGMAQAPVVTTVK